MNDHQSLWDRLLLVRFIDNFTTGKSSTRMWVLAAIFQDMTGVDPGILKRTPRNYHHGTMTASRFVCGHLPRLAKIIIDKDKTKEDIPDLVEKLRRWSIDTVIREHDQQKETSEKSYSAIKYKGSRVALACELGFKDDSSGYAGHIGKSNGPRPIRGHVR